MVEDQLLNTRDAMAPCALPVSSSIAQLFTAACANGWEEEDHSGIVRVIEILSEKR